MKYLFVNDSMKLEIEQDLVGFYLVVYPNPFSDETSEDYLLDTLEEAFDEARDKFGVLRNQWMKIDK